MGMCGCCPGTGTTSSAGQPRIQRDKLVCSELRARAGTRRMSASAVRVQWADVPQPQAGAKGVEVWGVWADKAALRVKVTRQVECQCQEWILKPFEVEID